jgi:dihydroceramidase
VYVSEPQNVATSAAYPLMAAYAWGMHHRLSLSRWHKLNLVVTMVMGVGSMIFHGTLRYWAQLLDELPLYTMAVLAAAALYQRAAHADGVQPMLAVWCVFLSGAILLSERESSLHSAARGVMVVSFSLAFIYIFTVAAVAGGEVDNKRGSADGARLFRRTFVSFVVAIVAWIGDIVLCCSLCKVRVCVAARKPLLLGYNRAVGVGEAGEPVVDMLEGPKEAREPVVEMLEGPKEARAP